MMRAAPEDANVGVTSLAAGKSFEFACWVPMIAEKCSPSAGPFRSLATPPGGSGITESVCTPALVSTSAAIAWTIEATCPRTVSKPDLDDIRRFAVARSLFPPMTLQGAIDALGFVQADPIRAPARAQDLTLRHRVEGYRAGDLERHYPTLDVHEDHFINYGFLSGRV
jgi:hypothetical protein